MSCNHTHIVGEGNKVYSIFSQKLFVARRKLNLNPILLEETIDIGWIFSTSMDIREEVVLIFKFPSCQHIFRLRCHRIGRHGQNHTANLKIRIDLMTDLRCQGRRHQLMMDRLIEVLLR